MSDRHEGCYRILIEGWNPPRVGLYQGSAWYAAQFELTLTLTCRS
jgi:hypothetical protein